MLDIKDADFKLIKTNLTLDDFLIIRDNADWKQQTVTINGYRIQLRRMTAWYGKSYTYTGITNIPKDIPDFLVPMFKLVEDNCGIAFNSVLLNRYKNGEDAIGWHSDNEKVLGVNPYIASLSLGQTRTFLLRHKFSNSEHKIELNHGDLFLMGNNSQILYEHSIPKEKHCKGERINLTFRNII